MANTYPISAGQRINLLGAPAICLRCSVERFYGEMVAYIEVGYMDDERVFRRERFYPPDWDAVKAMVADD